MISVLKATWYIPETVVVFIETTDNIMVFTLNHIN